MIRWVEDFGNIDDGLGALKDAKGFVSYSEIKFERFNCLLTYAEECIVKGTSDPAKFVLAALCLDYLQYKESDALMKHTPFKEKFDSTADKLENYSIEFGVVGIVVEREKYRKNERCVL